MPQAKQDKPVTAVVTPGETHRGGYPAGSKPVSQIKTPPQSVTKPSPKNG